MLVLLAVLAVTGVGFLSFVAYLCFCAFVVIRTDGTAGLRDVAVAMRAFGHLPVRGAK